MIVIDMDMPLNCRECPLRQRSEKYMGENYCMGMLGLLIKSDIYTKRADFCPIKCDIEQIRAEIERLHYHPKLDFIKNDDVVEMALEIIDKYTKGEQDE